MIIKVAYVGPIQYLYISLQSAPPGIYCHPSNVQINLQKIHVMVVECILGKSFGKFGHEEAIVLHCACGIHWKETA